MRVPRKLKKKRKRIIDLVMKLVSDAMERNQKIKFPVGGIVHKGEELIINRVKEV